MPIWKFFTAILFIYCLQSVPQQAQAQVVYGIVVGPNNVIKVIRVDLSNCSWCQVFEFPGAAAEIAIHPNGSILVTGNVVFGVNVYTPPSMVPVVGGNVPGIQEQGIAVSAGGTVYVSGSPGAVGTGSLYTYNMSTNMLTLVGDFPPNIQLSELYFSNGILYGMSTGTNEIYQVNTTDPTLSMPVSTISASFVTGIEGVPGLGVITSSVVPFNGLSLYDPTTGSLTNFCALSPPQGIRSLTAWPPGTPELPCGCTTNAGTLAAIPFNYCRNQPLLVPYPTGTVLNPEDVLQYVICTNPNNPLGTLVATANGPSVTFDPATMQTGELYFIGAMAGDSLLTGDVNVNDPCLDFSNFRAFIWRPLPTVNLTVANPDLCAGSCTTLNAQFTGTPPFTLGYTTPFGSFSQGFPALSGTLQVCTPQGSPPGSMVVDAVALSDQYCTCN